MARCPGLRKKAYAIVPEPYGAVHRNTVRGTPSCVFLQCCVCVCVCVCVRARMKAMGRAESDEVIIHCWSSL